MFVFRWFQHEHCFLFQEMKEKLKSRNSVDENELDSSTHTSIENEIETKANSLITKWSPERTELLEHISRLSGENIE